MQQNYLKTLNEKQQDMYKLYNMIKET
jgi:ankyrin repeat protein